MGAAECGQIGLKRRHLRPLEELAMGCNARNGIINGTAQPAPLSCDVDKRYWIVKCTDAVIHQSIKFASAGGATASNCDATRPFMLNAGRRYDPAFQTTRGDLKARDALLASDRWRCAIAYSVHEGN